MHRQHLPFRTFTAFRAGLFLVSALMASPCLAGDGPRPNVLFVAVDDLRPELGCYGVRGIKTPSESGPDPAVAQRPNVLFIAVDDLNDWVGCLGGHPQTRTPHIDRLAASGTLFTNAYCAGASCNPSRTAILTGLPPHRSGLYTNLQKMRQVLPDAELRALVPKDRKPKVPTKKP